jgi:hypothetical protein
MPQEEPGVVTLPMRDVDNQPPSRYYRDDQMGAVVLPKAVRRGESLGWNPHDPKRHRKVVVMDGQIPYELNLGGLTPAMAKRAMARADELTEEEEARRGSTAMDTPGDNHETRRTANFYRALIREFGLGEAITSEARFSAQYSHTSAAPKATPVSARRAPSAPAPAAPVPGVARTLKETFEMAQSPVPAAPVPPVVGPPRVAVFFESQLGDIRARYHHVMHGTHHATLIYDNRYDGGESVFLPRQLHPDEPAKEPPLFMVVDNGPEVLQVLPAGMVCQDDLGRTHCTLFVLGRRDRTPQGAPAPQDPFAGVPQPRLALPDEEDLL